MSGAADALDARGDAGRRLDLQHQVDRTHIDAKLERGRGDEPTQASRLELVLDHESLLARDRSVVGADELLFRQVVDPRRDALGQPARVDENDRRPMLADELQQARIDRRPDAVLALGAVLVLVCEPRHVLDRHLDPDFHCLQPAGIDDRDLPVGAAEESPHLLEGSLCRRQADALGLDLRQLAKPLQAEREVAAALGRGDGMDLVDDQPPDRRQDLARGAGEDQKQRLGRGDEDVGRVALHRAPSVCRRVPGSNRDCDLGRHQALALHLAPDSDQGRAQVAVDVVGERLQGRHIKDAAALAVGGHRLAGQPVEAPQEGGQRLAAPRRRRHQHMPPGRHLPPASLLDGGRLGEGGAKPVAHGR